MVRQVAKEVGLKSFRTWPPTTLSLQCHRLTTPRTGHFHFFSYMHIRWFWLHKNQTDRSMRGAAYTYYIHIYISYMYVWYVCMYVCTRMYVCMYVYMYVLYVCMYGSPSLNDPPISTPQKHQYLQWFLHFTYTDLYFLCLCVVYVNHPKPKPKSGFASALIGRNT